MKTDGIILEEFGSKVFYLKIQMQNGVNPPIEAFQTSSSYVTPGGPNSGTPQGNQSSAPGYQVQGRDYVSTLNELLDQH